MSAGRPFSIQGSRLSHVLARDCVDDIVGGCPEKLGDDGELVHMVLSWKQRLSFQHLGKNASGTPDVDLYIVFLPGEHDLWGTVVSCRDITRHLRILNPCKTEIADLQIAILVDEDITRF